MLLREGFHVTTTYSADTEAAGRCADEWQPYEGMYELVQASQGDREAIRAIARRFIEYGHIDCIVCNAGITLRKDFTDITDEEWEHVMDVNVNSNVYLIRDLLPVIQPGSRIIFIGSMMGSFPHATSLPYGVTKSALHALAMNLVKVFEGTGTTVNVIAPGFVETEWQKGKPEEIRNSIVSKTAVKRFAEVSEIADAVRFCLNNAFVNGSVIEVSGGYCFK